MSDHLTKEQRHKNMAAIRSKDTKPEMIVRHGLWKRGFRYRLNYKRLPGHPDLVLRKYRTCIFVNGCFWHGHDVDMIQPENSKCCKIPKTNRDFWVDATGTGSCHPTNDTGTGLCHVNHAIFGSHRMYISITRWYL